MVGRHCDLEILGASHVLDDALAVVGPPVDAEREVILCHPRASEKIDYQRLQMPTGADRLTYSFAARN
jgi:hypothetical protein